MEEDPSNGDLVLEDPDIKALGLPTAKRRWPRAEIPDLMSRIDSSLERLINANPGMTPFRAIRGSDILRIHEDTMALDKMTGVLRNVLADEVEVFIQENSKE